MRFSLACFFIVFIHAAYCRDSLQTNQLKVVSISEANALFDSTYRGKKVDIITFRKSPINLAAGQPRAIFNKVSGIFIWENDASNLQLSIASRGLNPNRSWEFNMRQNNIETAADPIGYPESYYTPPTEAVEKIEAMRGSNALLYGTQFGGMVNLITESASSKKMEFKNNTTIGSFNFISQFNKLSGKLNKTSYNLMHQFRKSDTWRDNNGFYSHWFFAEAQQTFSEKFKLSASLSYLNYLSQQPGGLTDSMLQVNASASNRSRNWVQLSWWLPVVKLNYAITHKQKIELLLNTSLGQRNSLGNVKPINLPDVLSANRQLDIDNFSNYSAELTYSNEYNIGDVKNKWVTKLKYFNGNMLRLQLGEGNANQAFELDLMKQYQRNLSLHSQSLSFATTNQLYWKKWTFSPGIRIEKINSSISGWRNTNQLIPQSDKDRFIFMAGAGIDYTINPKNVIYVNVNSNFRPILYSDLTPNNITDSIDPNMRDNTGYTAEMGYKHNSKHLVWEINGFYINYGNKIGTALLSDGKGQSFLYKTNIGNANHVGVEMMLDVNVSSLIKLPASFGQWRVSNSTAMTRATYSNARLYRNVSKGEIVVTELSGNRVENAPEWIVRSGVHYMIDKLNIGVYHSFTSSYYTDALNTEKANAAAQIGKIEEYQVIDCSLKLTMSSQIQLNMGCNNIFNAVYATRRAGGHPGPGLMPGDMRNFYFGIGLKF